jgi:WD40 repeat protein
MDDSLLIDQRRRWEQGDRVLVETYLRERPDLRSETDEVLELIEHELVLREERGESPQLEEYLRRFPDLARDLRLHFEVHAALETETMQGPAELETNGSPAGRAPVLAGYEVLGELGRGGMGVVYKARQVALNRVVALKMILAGPHADPVEVARFRREAEAVAQLAHPHIVQIYEVGESEGWPYLALEYVDGGGLHQHTSHLPQPAEAAARLVKALASAMHYAHQRGVVHRDLKPPNILLARSDSAHGIPLGSGPTNTGYYDPKITDFGLAKLLGTDMAGPTLSGEILGTPSYMAPEQAEGKTAAIGPATDIWALGAILYDLLTGRPPFHGDTPLETLVQVRFQEPVSPSRLQPKLPRDLVTICMTCLRKEPRKRYASAGDMADDLRRFLDRQPIRARRINALERAVKWARRRPAVAALLAVIVLVTGTSLAGFFGLWQRAEEGWRNAESERDAKDLAHKSEQAQRHQAEFHLYLNRVALAQHELLANNMRQANQLLDACPEEFRRWEWWYLHRRCHTDVFTLTDPSAQVGDVAFSPDGRSIATLCRDHTLVVSDVASQQVLYKLTLDKGPRASWMLGVAFSPDGRHLAMADYDSRVHVCDAATGGNLRAFAGHERAVNRVAFSRDGQRLASVSDDGTLRVWDVTTGQAIHVLATGHGRTIGVDWSPVGTVGASAGDDGTIRLWDLAAGKELRTLRGHWQQVLAVKFSPDGRFLAAGDWAGVVKVWNTATSTEVHTWSGHTAPVWSVAFSPDGLQVASAGFDGGLKIWNAWSGAESLRLSGHSGPINGLSFSPDGRLLVTGGDDFTVKVWDVTRERDVAELWRSTWLFAVAFSPADRHIVAAGGNREDVIVWDTQTGTVQHVLRGPRGDTTDVVFSADGQRLGAVAVVPRADLRRMVGANNRWQAKVWDLQTGQEIPPPGGKLAGVVALAFGPDGRALGVVADADCVTVRDLLAGRDLFRVCEDARSLQGAAFSRDGLALATAEATGTVMVWDTETGRQMLRLPANAAADPYTRLAFSRDHRQLAIVTADPVVTTDYVVSLWDLTTARLTASCRGHVGMVRGLAFSEDGRRLATAGHTDMTVKLWDTSTGQEALTLRGHKDHLEGVAFSADGQRLASVGWQQVVKVWDAVPRDREPPKERLRELDSETRAWHEREVANAERLSAGFGAVFHLDALIRADHENGKLYARRGHAHFQLENAQAAADDYARALAANVGDSRIRLNQAYLCLRDDDRDGYRAACGRALAALGPTPDALSANNTAWVCCLVPDAVKDALQVVRSAERAVADRSNRHAYLNTLGAARYRAGRWREAIQALEDGVKAHGRGGIVEDWLLLAMAHHQLGQADKARQWSTKAAEALDKEGPDSTVTWNVRLQHRLLRREADELLQRAMP